MRVFLAMLRKDLTIEGRARDLLPMMAVLVLLLLAMAGAAGMRRESAPAMLWIAVAMASAMGLTRSFHYETDQDQLHGLRLAPVDPALVYLGKAAANFLIVTAVEMIAFGAVTVFFDVAILQRPASLAMVLLLGTGGVVAMGTLLGTMLAVARLREVLLPVLLLPISAPALMAAAGATAKLFREPALSIRSELQVLAAFTLLFVATSVVLFDHIIED